MDIKEYNEIWEKIVLPKYRELNGKYGDITFNSDSAKDEVYQYYVEIRDYAKRHYMEKHDDDIDNHLLNRYKVAASLMIAILKVHPLKKCSQKFYKEPDIIFVFNEILALYVGLSIIRNFIICDAEQPAKEWSEDKIKEAKQLAALFKKSFPINSVQREQWHLELYFLRQEGCYNVLTLAHELEDFVTIAFQKEKIRIFENMS